MPDQWQSTVDHAPVITGGWQSTLEHSSDAPPGIAKPPIPKALQGPPPSIGSHALTNLPYSLMDLPAKMTHATPGMPMGVETLGPPRKPGNTTLAERWASRLEDDPTHGINYWKPDPIRDVTEGAKSLWNTLTNLPEYFAEDPAGAALLPAQLARGGKTIIESPGGQLAGAAAGGAVKGAAGGIRPFLSNFNITKPLKTLPDLYDFGKEIYQGARKGVASERAAQIPRTSRVVEPNPLPPPPGLVEPIPGTLPSGRVPGSIANQPPPRIVPPRAPQFVQPRELTPPPAMEPIPGNLPSGRKPGSIANQTLTSSAAPVATGPSPELLDQIAMGMGGRKFARLDPAGQATVRIMAEKVQGGTPSAPTTIPPPPGIEPPEASASTLPPPRDYTSYRGQYRTDPEDFAHARRAQKTVKWAEYLNNKGIEVPDLEKLDWAKHAKEAGLHVPQSSASVNQIRVLLHDLKGGLPPPPQ